MTGAARCSRGGACAPAPAWCGCRSRRRRSTTAPIEVVQRPLPRTRLGRGGARRRWTASTRSWSGPGSGATTTRRPSVRQRRRRAPLPLVVDGDGLFALAWSSDGAAALLRRRTPDGADAPRRRVRAAHRAAARRPTAWSAARRLAADTGCRRAAKGPATVVAEPDGDALVVTAATRGWPPPARATCSRDHRRAARQPGRAAHAAAAGGVAARPGRPPWATPRLRRRRPPRPDLRRCWTTRGCRRRRWAWAEVDLGAIAHNVGVLVLRPRAGGGVGRGQGRRLRPRRRRRRPGGADGGAPGPVRRARRRRVWRCARPASTPDPRAQRAAAGAARRRRRRRARPRPSTRTRSCEALAAAGGRDHPGAPQGRHRHAPRGAAAHEALGAGRGHRRSPAPFGWPGCSPTSPSPTSPTTRSPPPARSVRRRARRARRGRAPTARSCTPPTRPARSPTRRARSTWCAPASPSTASRPAPASTALAAELRPALSLQARVSHVKRVRRRRPASPTACGTSFAGDTDRRHGAARYADGVPRGCSSAGGEVLIGGRRRPIVGIVTMDQLMVDCGDDEWRVGDEVVLIGAQGDERDHGRRVGRPPRHDRLRDRVRDRARVHRRYSVGVTLVASYRRVMLPSSARVPRRRPRPPSPRRWPGSGAARRPHPAGRRDGRRQDGVRPGLRPGARRDRADHVADVHARAQLRAPASTLHHADLYRLEQQTRSPTWRSPSCSSRRHRARRVGRRRRADVRASTSLVRLELVDGDDDARDIVDHAPPGRAVGQCGGRARSSDRHGDAPDADPRHRDRHRAGQRGHRRARGRARAVRGGRGRRHAETLTPAIEFVCRQADIELDEIGVVAVDVGPGSVHRHARRPGHRPRPWPTRCGCR